MSKIKTKIYKLDDEYKLTVYSGDESFDLYFDTEEDADEIADLAQSYDSFEEAQSELDSDGDGELDDEDDELDDEDTSITEKVAGPKDIKSVVDAINKAGVLKKNLVYNGKFKDFRELGVNRHGLPDAAVEAGICRLTMVLKDEYADEEKDIINDIIEPLGYHYVSVNREGLVLAPKSLNKEKIYEIIRKSGREEYIENTMDDSDLTLMFKSDKLLIYAEPCVDARYYNIFIEDITPKSFEASYFNVPSITKSIMIKSRLRYTADDIKLALKGNTSLKDAYNRITKYLKDNGIQYKIIM